MKLFFCTPGPLREQRRSSKRDNAAQADLGSVILSMGARSA